MSFYTIGGFLTEHVDPATTVGLYPGDLLQVPEEVEYWWLGKEDGSGVHVQSGSILIFCGICLFSREHIMKQQGVRLNMYWPEKETHVFNEYAINSWIDKRQSGVLQHMKDCVFAGQKD